MVNLDTVADRMPGQLSGGMRQRVAIARAFALQPKLLLLDEPFGALDALTRGHLQSQLMDLCQNAGITTVMVTHDVDEALLLSDRIILLTNGPKAHIGRIISVPFERPRCRKDVLNNPNYYTLRNELLEFLHDQKKVSKRQKKNLSIDLQSATSKQANLQTIQLGYLAGLDAAPLLVAKQRKLFEKYGLNIELLQCQSWCEIDDLLRLERLDGAALSAAQPLSMAAGAVDSKSLPMVVSQTLSRNGNALVLSSNLGISNTEELLHKLRSGDELRLGVPDRLSMAELLLRHWLAAQGVDPEQISWQRRSPITLLAAMEADLIDGFAAGKLRACLAKHRGSGKVVLTDASVWPNHAEKVLAFREAWVDNHRNQAVALTGAVLEAANFCDQVSNRDELLEVLAAPEAFGPQLLTPIQEGFSDTEQSLNLNDATSLLRFNRYFLGQACYPDPAEGLWVLTQLARWGMSELPSHRQELLDRVYDRRLFLEACELVGINDQEPSKRVYELANGEYFNVDDPIGYLKNLPFSALNRN